MATSPPTAAISDADVAHLLSRLSSKASVQSLLILSRDDGSIVQATGAIARTPAAAAGDEDADDSLERYATVVYRHVKATEEMVKGLEEVEVSSLPEQDEEGPEGDDVKLVRVRTKRRELVVVPDKKYILVVFHDTPAAP